MHRSALPGQMTLCQEDAVAFCHPDDMNLCQVEEPLTPGLKMSGYEKISTRPSTNNDFYAVAMERVACAMEGLDAQRHWEVDSDSVYGFAFVMPQVARSSGWDRTFTIMAVRSYLNLLVNLVLQFWLVWLMGESSQVISPLGGQMHLCDFAAEMDNCPDGTATCFGPGGTQYTKTRLYSYTQWAIQNFVKQALLSVVPDKADLIHEKVDPGEYGQENARCRILCCFVFVLSVCTEIESCYKMAKLTYATPTEEGAWVKFKLPESGQKLDIFDITTFLVAGMPMRWKLANTLFVLTPKILLCWFVLEEGFGLLMDESEIAGLVLGAMSMSFILSLDEMVCEVACGAASKYIMDNLGLPEDPVEDDSDFQPVDTERASTDQHGEADFERASTDQQGDIGAWETQEEAIAILRSETRFRTWVSLFDFAFPKRITLSLGVTVFFMTKYYLQNCNLWHGLLVSKEMHLPQKASYHLIDFFTQTVPVEDEPYWTMPNVDI